MSSKKFRVWEVTAYSRGSIRTIARFPFREKANADELARELQGGYVLPANVSHPLDMAEILTEGDKKPAEQPESARKLRVSEQSANADTLPPVKLACQQNWT